MDKLGFEDRRAFLRFDVDLPLKYTPLDSQDTTQCKAKNICAKGIGIFTDKEVPLRSALDIWLDIPNEREPFNTKGEVIWIQKVGANLFMVGISLERPEFMAVSRILRYPS